MYIKKRPDVVRLSLKGVSGSVVVIVAIFIYSSRKILKKFIFTIKNTLINSKKQEYQVKSQKIDTFPLFLKIPRFKKAKFFHIRRKK